jgi:hypothetical protein
MSRTARSPVSIEATDLAKLKKLASVAGAFIGEPVSTAAAVRYAMALMDEEAAVWLDMGQPDQEEVRKRLRSCRREVRSRRSSRKR